MTVGYEGRVHDEPSRRSPAGSASQPDLMMMMMMTVMMVVTMMLMMMTMMTMMIMMMMVMMMMMMMMVVVVVVGKEEQKGKEKERQSLYTLTPDRPPLRPEYYIDMILSAASPFPTPASAPSPAFAAPKRQYCLTQGKS